MSSSAIKLSRLAITGEVSSTTPAVVLKEIANAHSIVWDAGQIRQPNYRVRLIHVINTKDVNVLKEPYDQHDYKIIARFVNRDRRWKVQKLNQAFRFLMQYMNIEKLKETHLNFKFGIQTPETPESLNACVLYGICKANRIETRFDSTIDEMASNIEMLFSLRDTEIYRSIRTAIYESMMYGSCEGYQLVNMLSQIDPERSVRIMNLNTRRHSPNTIIQNIDTFTEVIIEHEELRIAAGHIRTRNIRTNPRTHVEAVAMAAIYYSIDISKTRNPLAEYQEIIRTPYFPLDRTMARRLQLSNRHPDSIENPHLNRVFNPELPSNLYNDSELDLICLAEGYRQEDIREEGAYTLLQTSCFLPTFYHGKQGTIINHENTMLDELSELEYDNVIVYGVRGQNMSFYTYGELTDTFKTLRRFQRPDEDLETYSDIAINKLYLLSQHDQRNGESHEIFRERLELAEEIDSLRLYIRAREGPANIFIRKYELLKPEEKMFVNNTLTQLLHCAMYMRGWKGPPHPYPLSSEDAGVAYEDQIDIDIRVTESLANLDRMINELNRLEIGEDSSGSEFGIGDAFKALPLIFYHERSNELLPSTSEDEGLTIYQRIVIVRGGENGDSIQSCIRMSSNRFAASAYYYMKSIGLGSPFNIEELSHIM